MRNSSVLFRTQQLAVDAAVGVGNRVNQITTAGRRVQNSTVAFHDIYYNILWIILMYFNSAYKF